VTPKKVKMCTEVKVLKDFNNLKKINKLKFLEVCKNRMESKALRVHWEVKVPLLKEGVDLKAHTKFDFPKKLKVLMSCMRLVVLS